MIRTEQLSKIFKVGFWLQKVQALKDLTLTVEKGEVFGFLGPNGAGKTTTIKILVGLIKPTSGRAFILGKPAGDIEVLARIGFLPEQPIFYEYLSGEEFLNFCAKFFPLTEAEKKKRIDYLLNLVRLEGARRLPLRKFSKGMLQRIGLAQALIHNPELVILDEPMSGLDPIGRKEMRDLIVQLKSEGKTIFFNTHILSDVEIICDRVGIIHQGRLLKLGSIEELSRSTINQWEIQAEIKKEQLRAGLEGIAKSIGASVSWQGNQALIQSDDEEKAERLLRSILEQGGKVIEYSTRRASLEEFFLKTVSGGKVE